MNIQKRVSYDATDIAAATAKEQLKDGAIVAVVIDKIEKVESEKPPKNPDSGPGTDMMLKWQLSILDPNDGQTRLKRHRIFGTSYLPLRDPDSEEHIAPEWSHSLFAQFIQAFLPDEHSKAPRKENGVMMFQGQEIDVKKVAKIELDLAKKRFEEAASLWNDGPDKLLHLAAYATLKHSNVDGNVFVNANNLRPELSIDSKTGIQDELTPLDELVEKVSAAPVTGKTNGKTNGAKGRAKPAKKPARRGRARA